MQEASIVTISSCEPKRMKTDDDDDDLPLPPFKKKRQCKSRSPEKVNSFSSDFVPCFRYHLKSHTCYFSHTYTCISKPWYIYADCDNFL